MAKANKGLPQGARLPGPVGTGKGQLDRPSQPLLQGELRAIRSGLGSGKAEAAQRRGLGSLGGREEALNSSLVSWPQLLQTGKGTPAALFPEP